MDRVLSLQALTTFPEFDVVSEGCSGTSNVCSSSSGGTGDSGCSVKCGGSEDFDW